MTHSVERGLALALEAHRKGLLSEHALGLIAGYYDDEGAAQPLPPEEVLQRLGALSREQVQDLSQSLSLSAHGLSAADRAGVQRLDARLTLLGMLGEGGMGSVYRAYDRVLRRIVAVKLIRNEVLGANAEKHLARFKREAQTMAKVRHPACVAIFDAGVTREGRPFLVMEYVQGQSLADVLNAARAKGERLDVRQGVGWGKAVAEALHASHEAGVIHRDVKPANILIDGDQQPRLTDFGIAFDTEARTRLTAERAAVGTLAYLPPEQATGGAVDGRSDVYALGATLYEALCGRDVFEADVALLMLAKIASEPPTPPRALRPELDADLEGILLTCLEKEPQDRYPSAQALALDLSRWLAGEPVRARPLGRAARLARRLWRRRRPIAAVLAVLVVATLTLAGLRRAQDQRERAAAQALITREADALLDACAQWPKTRRALRERHERLQIAIDWTVPPGESPLKREALALELELETATRDALLAFAQAERLLAQAGVALSPAAVAQRRARLALARGHALEDDDPSAAETHFARAERDDRLSGGALTSDLARPTLRIATTPAATYTLYRYSLSPTDGHQVPKRVAKGQTPSAAVDLEPGEYLLELESPGHFPARRPLTLRRGEPRELSLQLPALSTLGPFGDAVVFVPGGRPRFNQYLRAQPKPTASFFMKRHEVTFEEWRSFMIATRATAELLPGGVSAELLLSRRASRWAVSSVSVAAAEQFLSWLQLELILHGVDCEARLPTYREFHWALRGELAWPFPWGRRHDPTFMDTALARGGVSANGDANPSGDALDLRRRPVGSFPVDCSPAGVHDLASSLSEFTATRRGAVQLLGGNYSTANHAAVLDAVLRAGQATNPAQSATDTNGFRYTLQTVPPEHRPQRPPPDAQASARFTEHARTLLASATATDRPLLTRAFVQATNAVKANSTNADAWHVRATARQRLGDSFGARWDFARFLKLAPDDPRADKR